MRLSFFRFVLLLACGLALASCTPRSAKREKSPACSGKLADLVGRPLGSADAPVRVVACLPVINGCQDVIGEYLVEVAERFPAVFQVLILSMKSAEGREAMAANGIRCAAVIINGKTTFDLGGNEGKFMLEGPMDPLDVARALAAAARAAVGEQAPTLPKPPALPGIENMPKRMMP